MTANEFRRMALSLPLVTEAKHQGHPDFRVDGKIFATLGYPDKSWAMVKLPAKVQGLFVRSEPDVFVPAKGAWGFRGATCVLLRRARNITLREALAEAWHNTAPNNLKRQINFRE